MAFNPRSTTRQRYRNDDALQAAGLKASELIAGDGITITNVDGLVNFSVNSSTSTPDYEERTGVTNTAVLLTAASKTYQVVVGTASPPYTIRLPDTSTLSVGRTFIIHNRMTGVSPISITTSATTAVTTVLALGQAVRFTCISTATNNASAWFFGTEIVTENGAVQIGTVSLTSQAAGNVNIGLNSSGSSNLGTSVAIGNTANASGDGAIAIGANATTTDSEGNSIAIGNGATVSLGKTDNATVVGAAAVCDVDGGLCLGYLANSASITGAVVLSGRNLAASPAANTHAFTVGINTNSVAPGYFGMTLNGATYAVEAYSSLFATTATSAGTTTLTATSARYQVFTGTTTHTVVLPVVTTLRNGYQIEIWNRSTGSVQIQTSGGNVLTNLAISPDGVRARTARCMVIDTTAGTGAASWTFDLSA